MTPDERALLTNFLDELANARGVSRDAEADGMIRRTLAANPDAMYLLVQHAIVADQSLHAAQARIADLERQTSQQQQPSGGFLPPAGSNPWGSPSQPQQPAYAQPAYAQQEYAPPPPEQRPGIFSGGGGLGSFLRTAGTTAAGVAGGEMLFSGLSDMFGGHRGGGGGMFGGGQGFTGGGEENVTINNYGDDGDNDDRGGDDGDDGDDDRGNW